MSAERLAGDGGSAGEGRLEPFDLTVNLGPDSIPWISATSRVGSVHGIPRSDPSLPRLPELLDLVYDYTDAVRFPEPELELGLAPVLGDLVFGDPMVRQLFQATRGVAADRGRQVLVRILASPHLAVLPWELLPDPATARTGDHGYLALAPDVYLVRLARGRTYPARSGLLDPPLNLLIVLSSPTPEGESDAWLAFDIYEVKRALLAELSPLERAGMLCIDVEDRPTLDNLRRRIGAQRRGYHLFHYVGHALPDHLILEDHTGRRKDVPSSQLVEILRLCPDLRLAVFAGCETARAATDPELLDVRKATGWRDLLSLADCFVQEVCPAVIGMQAVLPIPTERILTRFFYQALANGYSTGEALRLARGAIRGDEHLGSGLLDWSVPALFVGSTEPGALLPRSTAVSRPEVHPRADLKLGLRQSDERFFARELQLRQAVDFLKGLTPGRVLVITGAPGVGKTSLVDRAFDELGDVIRPEDLETAVTHVLYVHFRRLAPKVAQAWEAIETDTMPDLAALAELDPDEVLEQLCSLAVELLRQGGGTARDKEALWKGKDWWDRIVEDLVQHRFVLAIDQICLLDRVERALLDWLIRRWLRDDPEAELDGADLDQKTAVLDRLMRDLAALQRIREDCETDAQALEAGLALLPTGLKDELEEEPGVLPDRLMFESWQVFQQLVERQVAALSQEVTSGEPASGAGWLEPVPEGVAPADLKAALCSLEQVRTKLTEALEVLAERRSPARIVLTAVDMPPRFLDLPEGSILEMRLAPLTWPDTWRWIHSSLPALNSFGEQYLSQVWPRLGAQGDRWEELEGRVVRDRGKAVDLQTLARQIAPRRKGPARGAEDLAARRGQRPLRIAVAGDHLGSVADVAEAFTQLAAKHGLGGRYVLSADEAGALAMLIDEPSPFTEGEHLTWEKIRLWVRQVLARRPDIVLLDYTSEVPKEALEQPRDWDAQRVLLRSSQNLSLLIAAGGHLVQNPDMVSVPSAYSEVLSVGPLDNDGKLRPYAEWHPDLIKPDLFMADDLSQTELKTALKPDRLKYFMSSSSWGSSFSALHAVAAAALVWSILPDLSPRAVRELLVEACQPVGGEETARSLTIEDALSTARRRAVARALRSGSASFQTLGAKTGIEAQILWATLDSLLRDEKVVRRTAGRLERYQLSG